MNVLIFPVNTWGVGVWLWSGFSLLFSLRLRGCGRRNKCQPRRICSIHSNTHSRSPPSSLRCVQQHHSIFSIQFRLTYQELPAYRQREPSPGPPSFLFVQTLLLWGWNVCFIKSAIEAQQWPLMFDCVISIIRARARARPHVLRSFQSSNRFLWEGWHNGKVLVHNYADTTYAHSLAMVRFRYSISSKQERAQCPFIKKDMGFNLLPMWRFYLYHFLAQP